MNKRIITFAAVILATTVAYCRDQAAPNEGLPPVAEVKGVRPLPAAFKAAKRLQPIQLKSEKEAARFFKPTDLKKIVKQVNFDRQFVLVFAWRGSGGDRLTVAETFARPENVRHVEFRLRPGKTRDLRPHVHVYAVRSDVKWKVTAKRAR